MVESIGNPPIQRNAHGVLPRVKRAHIYIDKNVLIDWGMRQAFADQTQQASWDIVELVRKGRVWASISSGAPLTVYNRIRWRARQDHESGGRGMTEEAAEELAVQVVKDMLIGTWQIIAIDATRLRRSIADRGNLSWEDAIERMGFQEARTGSMPPRWLVTRDRDFSEGLPPWEVMRRIGSGQA
jgi:hypothetical protein